MSLLLDALKKAAQEKQKAREGDAKEKAAAVPSTDVDLELSLDDDITEKNSPPAETGIEQTLTLETTPELEKATATTSTVSDEALQLLVYKTNKRHRHTQKVIWGSIISGALFILFAGGASYYYGMLEDVESLERKHELAMRMVQTQPINRPHILQSMQPDRAVNEATATNKKISKKTQPAVDHKVDSVSVKKSQAGLTIQKSEKRDPISLLLNRAWHAYAEQDYKTAEDAYREVLNREPKNRDALLGDAAVAMKKENYARARAAYGLLLRLDPRDPIATAGLASLDEVTTDTLGESKLKFMLQQRPDASHIHFALGNLYARQKKWPDAQNEYFEAWQGNSENADYAFNLAVSLDQIGKYPEARRFYESSLVLASTQNISFSVDAVTNRIAQLAGR